MKEIKYIILRKNDDSVIRLMQHYHDLKIVRMSETRGQSSISRLPQRDFLKLNYFLINTQIFIILKMILRLTSLQFESMSKIFVES